MNYTYTYCYQSVTDAAYARDTTGCLNDVRDFSFAVLDVPTAEQIRQICASPKCLDIIAAVKNAQKTECRIVVGVSLYADVIDRVEAVCPGKAVTLSPLASPTPEPKNSSVVSNTTVNVVPSPAPSPVPAPAPVDTKSGLSTGSIVAITIGAVVVVLLVVVSIIWLLRRRNKNAQEKTAGDDGFAYADLSDQHTADSLDGSDFLRGGLELAAVRIPLDDIQLGKVVSQGGFGEVLHGVYNNEAVAIKRLLASRRKEPLHIHSFFKEIRLTATLKHECIVRFIGVAWDVPADLCMVSEFMHGGDLRSLLLRYTQEGHAHGHDDGKIRIAVDIAHALTYLHGLDTPVVHRDIKSRNILLTESLDAKVIDFGISCERQDVTMTAGVGTSLWMAPEVMLGKRYDEKADVFSFGVILSELDTHQLPYDDAVDMDANRKMADMVLMNLICDGKLKPRFTEFADPDMVALATDCLEVDPAKRPRASEVLHRIHLSYQNNATLSAETRSAIERGLRTAGVPIQSE